MIINFLTFILVSGYQLNHFPFGITNSKFTINLNKNINMLNKKINNINIWYQDLGKAEDPAVVLIMGSYANCNLWPSYFIDSLLINNYRVIKFDNRDSGQSTWINNLKSYSSIYSLDDMVYDTVELVNNLNITNFHLIGLSMGGMISQIIAYKYYNRILSLNLLFTSPILWEIDNKLLSPSSKYINSLRESIKFHQENNILEGLKIIYNCLYINNLTETKLNILIETILKGGYNPNSYHYMAMSNYKPLINRSLTFNFTTLIVQGSKDPLFDIKHGLILNLMITNSNLLILEECGHQLDNYVTNRIIKQLLDNLNLVNEI